MHDRRASSRRAGVNANAGVGPPPQQTCEDTGGASLWRRRASGPGGNRWFTRGATDPPAPLGCAAALTLIAVLFADTPTAHVHSNGGPPQTTRPSEPRRGRRSPTSHPPASSPPSQKKIHRIPPPRAICPLASARYPHSSPPPPPAPLPLPTPPSPHPPPAPLPLPPPHTPPQLTCRPWPFWHVPPAFPPCGRRRPQPPPHPPPMRSP